MKRWPLFASAAAAFAIIGAGCGGGGEDEERATIGIHYSRFTPEEISARAGEPITIVLRNEDPIAHEWMVGDNAMHERHRTGTEPYHDEIPTEVTIPALSERVTTVTFEKPGVYEYICHLPGHEAYGMKGVVRVT
jgi:uncharacterized cupredoxin-like copper-binding protein